MLSQEDQELLRGLRNSLEDRYREGLRAIHALEAMLSGQWVSAAKDEEAASTLSELVRYLHRQGSLRDRVRDCISSDYRSINQISAETGLSKKQIRGVLYNPDLKDHVLKSNQFGEVQFKLRIRKRQH